MKLLFISGAYKNAGDYLILERCMKLIMKLIPDAEVEIILANKYFEDLNYINSFDYIILPGGPGYIYNYYPKFIKLHQNLDEIKPKFLAIGMGWYGIDSTNSTVYNYKFSNETIKLLKRIQKDTGILGCRDNYSVRVLKNNGFDAPLMTGCPAWYDMEHAEETEIRKDIDYSFKKICVSDPANIYENANQCVDLLKYLKTKFPNSEIKFVFHRGDKQDEQTDKFTGELTDRLKSKIKELGIECYNIAYGSEGFSIYDDVDLHIGYRVHAHIYNLSKRNLSILIEEDGRGAGVNEALGLMTITSYDKKKKQSSNIINRGKNKILKLMRVGRTEKTNNYLIKNIDDYLFLLESNGYLEYKIAFKKMKDYYQIMVDNILKSFK